MHFYFKISLLFWLIFSSRSLNAQFSLTIPDSTGTWRYYHEIYDFLGSYYEQYRLYINGDSSLNGHTYTKLYKGLYHDADSTNQLIGLYRQDSGKVFFYDVESYFFDVCNGDFFEGEEQVMYDYNMTVGDTIWYPNSTSSISNFAIKLDSISSKTILGQAHRLFYFSIAVNSGFAINPTQSYYWIEGMGSCYGFFPGEHYFERWPQFLCLHSEGNDFDNDFEWLNKSCSSLGIEENSYNQSLTIYPNPSQGAFFINSTFDGFHSFVLKTLDGKIINSGNFTGNNHAFKLALPNGIYFITFSFNGTQTTERLIIQN